jgi:hypothetical protein
VHALSRGFANVEIYICLFVAFGVLSSPKHQQQRRKLRKDNLRPVDLRVTPSTEGDRQMQNRLARFAMMHSGSGITAHPTFSPLSIISHGEIDRRKAGKPLRILVDYARKHNAEMRGRGLKRAELQKGLASGWRILRPC